MYFNEHKIMSSRLIYVTRSKRGITEKIGPSRLHSLYVYRIMHDLHLYTLRASLFVRRTLNMFFSLCFSIS